MKHSKEKNKALFVKKFDLQVGKAYERQTRINHYPDERQT